MSIGSKTRCPDDDGRQWPLYFGTGADIQRHGHEPETRDQCRRKDWAKAFERALNDRVLKRVPGVDQFADEGEHHDTV